MVDSVVAFLMKYGYPPKIIEKASIFASIISGEAVTRKQLNKKFKVRPNNITQQVGELIEAGLVHEDHPLRENRQGRPEILLKANPQKLVSVGIWVESDILYSSLLGLDGNLTKSYSIKLAPETNNEGFQIALEQLLSCILRDVTSDQIIVGIGLSLPGVCDFLKKLWIFTSRWPHIQNYDFSTIEQKYHLPIHLDNKIESELEVFTIKNSVYQNSNVFLVHWGYGIGGAYSHSGKVLHSKFGKFAEIGHISLLNLPNLPCRCGEMNCVEAIASGWAMMDYLEKKYHVAFENEKEFGLKIQNINFDNEPIMEASLAAMSEMMNTIYKLFCPEIVLFYGPFTTNKGIRTRLTQKIERIIPDYLVATKLVFLDNDLSDYDPVGATLPLEKKALIQRLLQ